MIFIFISSLLVLIAGAENVTTRVGLGSIADPELDQTKTVSFIIHSVDAGNFTSSKRYVAEEIIESYCSFMHQIEMPPHVTDHMVDGIDYELDFSSADVLRIKSIQRLTTQNKEELKSMIGNLVPFKNLDENLEILETFDTPLTFPKLHWQVSPKEKLEFIKNMYDFRGNHWKIEAEELRIRTHCMRMGIGFQFASITGVRNVGKKYGTVERAYAMGAFTNDGTMYRIPEIPPYVVSVDGTKIPAADCLEKYSVFWKCTQDSTGCTTSNLDLCHFRTELTPDGVFVRDLGTKWIVASTKKKYTVIQSNGLKHIIDMPHSNHLVVELMHGTKMIITDIIIIEGKSGMNETKIKEIDTSLIIKDFVLEDIDDLQFMKVPQEHIDKLEQHISQGSTSQRPLIIFITFFILGCCIIATYHVSKCCCPEKMFWKKSVETPERPETPLIYRQNAEPCY